MTSGSTPSFHGSSPTDELELSKAETFRDLSKPMGAQTVEPFQQFPKRYKEWDDPHNEMGPYHYVEHHFVHLRLLLLLQKVSERLVAVSFFVFFCPFKLIIFVFIRCRKKKNLPPLSSRKDSSGKGFHT